MIEPKVISLDELEMILTMPIDRAYDSIATMLAFEGVPDEKLVEATSDVLNQFWESGQADITRWVQ
jgi:hypothetical protein